MKLSTLLRFFLSLSPWGFCLSESTTSSSIRAAPLSKTKKRVLPFVSNGRGTPHTAFVRGKISSGSQRNDTKANNLLSQLEIDDDNISFNYRDLELQTRNNSSLSSENDAAGSKESKGILEGALGDDDDDADNFGKSIEKDALYEAYNLLHTLAQVSFIERLIIGLVHN